jgi:xanthan lyase
VLIVNNFHRLASPQVVDDEEKQGFDLNQDPGVSYGLTAGWSGKQQVFDRSRMGNETSFGLGFSGNEMIGKFVAGNDFNYVQAHATSIAASGKYNISSCSSEVIASGRVQMKNYQAVDLINGLERHDGYTHAFFKSFTPALQNSIRQYASQGGRILISGSYTGSDMQTEEEQAFLSDILKLSYEPTGSTAITRDINPEDSTVTERDSIVYTSPNVKGLGLQFSYYNELNAQHYAATHPEILKPVGNYAFTAMQYDTGTSAAVAYKSTTYRSFVMGFPLECIIDERTRTSVLLGILKFLTD